MRDLVLALHSAGGVILRELALNFLSLFARKWQSRFTRPLLLQAFSPKLDSLLLSGSLPRGDIPMAQFIINYNNTLPPSQQFIIHVLDSTHLFVQPHAAEMIRSAISEFRDQNSYEKPT
ncbi:hypothetical protein PRUPE_5G081200 [Prunus persica]|uniref:General transcription and DNA repair factor IIH subunit TFB5 n=1 Tax=Prunus persica TaxID=3760 RepID=A0A251P5E8_PRUPE|nr:hypothetical protein PRUPE_5G081200 [Prunus persica]